MSLKNTGKNVPLEGERVKQGVPKSYFAKKEKKPVCVEKAQ